MSKLERVVRILESQEPEEISVIFRSSTGHHRFDSLVQQISVLADILSTPLSIGGFSSFQDPSFAAIFKAGADKIIINSLFRYSNKLYTI